MSENSNEIMADQAEDTASHHLPRHAFLSKSARVLGAGGLLGALTSPITLPSTLVHAAAKGTITVGVEAGGPYSLFYKQLAPLFTAQTGIHVRFIDVPHDNMHQQFLTQELTGTGAFDVYQADQPWVAEFAAAGFLVPLGNKLSAKDRADYFPVALAAESYKGEVYALPYLVHNSVLYYRADLFKQAGLQPPTTWSAYRMAAKKLTNPGQGIYGTILEGKQSGEASSKFLDLVQQAGGGVLDKHGAVIFGDRPTLDAFNLMLAMQYADHTSPPGAPGFDNPDTDRLFMQGKLAMAPNWPYMYALATDPKTSKVAGKIGVAVQPGLVKRAAEVFSWGYGISAHSKNKDLAWEFVRWASSAPILTRLAKTFTNPVSRRSSMQALLSDPQLSAQAKSVITTMTRSVSLSQTIPMVPKWPTVETRIAVALSKIMTRQASPQTEVKAAAADIKSALG